MSWCNYCQKQFVFKSFLLWGILWLLISCSSKPDSGFWGDSSCMPPCWNNITPGVTVESDALSIITGSPLIQPDSLKERRYENPNIYEYVFRLQQDSIGSFAINRGIVYQVHLTPAFDLQLKDIINRFGEPEYIFSEETGGGLVSYTVNLYYPSQGIIIQMFWHHETRRYRDVPLGSFKLEEELLIESIYYFQPAESFEMALMNAWQHDEEKARYILSNLVGWDGLDVYAVITK